MSSMPLPHVHVHTHDRTHNDNFSEGELTMDQLLDLIEDGNDSVIKNNKMDGNTKTVEPVEEKLVHPFPVLTRHASIITMELQSDSSGEGDINVDELALDKLKDGGGKMSTGSLGRGKKGGRRSGSTLHPGILEHNRRISLSSLPLPGMPDLIGGTEEGPAGGEGDLSFEDVLKFEMVKDGGVNHGSGSIRSRTGSTRGQRMGIEAWIDDLEGGSAVKRSPSSIPSSPGDRKERKDKARTASGSSHGEGVKLMVNGENIIAETSLPMEREHDMETKQDKDHNDQDININEERTKTLVQSLLSQQEQYLHHQLQLQKDQFQYEAEVSKSRVATLELELAFAEERGKRLEREMEEARRSSDVVRARTETVEERMGGMEGILAQLNQREQERTERKRRQSRERRQTLFQQQPLVNDSIPTQSSDDDLHARMHELSTSVVRLCSAILGLGGGVFNTIIKRGGAFRARHAWGTMAGVPLYIVLAKVGIGMIVLKGVVGLGLGVGKGFVRGVGGVGRRW